MNTKALRGGAPQPSVNLLDRIEDKLTWRWFDRRLARENPRNHAFDARYGTDTAAEIDLTQAGLSAAAARRGNSVYRVFWEDNFAAVFRDLPINHARYSFVDVGSGKGKLLLLASHYPFRQVVGVELAPALHETALRNIAIYRDPAQQCTQLASQLGDALEFALPDGPAVFLMVNPFDASTIAKVLARIGRSAKDHAQPIFAVYANMRRITEPGPIFDGIAGLDVLVRRRNHIILGNAAAKTARVTRS